MRLTNWWAIPFLVAISGCSGSPAGSDGPPDMSIVGGGSYSCLIDQYPGKRCSDDTWTGQAGSQAAEDNGCSSFHGMRVTICDRTGAVGGCRISVTNASGMFVSTFWLYDGTVDAVKAGCAAVKAEFVSP